MSLDLNVQTLYWWHVKNTVHSYPRVNWCLTLYWHFYVKSMSFLVKYKWNFIRQRIAVFRKKSQPWAIICRYLFTTYPCCAMDCCLVVPSHYLNWYWHINNQVMWHSLQGNRVFKSSSIIYRNILVKIHITVNTSLSRMNYYSCTLTWCSR